MWSGKIIILYAVFILRTANGALSQKSVSDLIPTNNATLKRQIALYHNNFRKNVSPTASNMLLMSWDTQAGLQAQAYAEECKYVTHNLASQRVIAQLGTCGQNLYASSKKTTWNHAIGSWFNESQIFTYGAGPRKNLTGVGHYTQGAWATSHKVGCGMAYCKGGSWGYFYNYVCHYCPAGNILSAAHYPYKSGTPCGDCPKYCANGKLCTNTCMHRDKYSNCGDLVEANSAYCNKGYCNATCNCGTSKIYKNYPWE